MVIIVSILSLLYITNDVIYGNFQDTTCTMLYLQCSQLFHCTAGFPVSFQAGVLCSLQVWSTPLHPPSSSKQSHGTDPLTCRCRFSSSICIVVFISWVQVVRHSEMSFTLSRCGLRTEGDGRWQGEDSLMIASEGIC